jgi:hypothetical protein
MDCVQRKRPFPRIENQTSYHILWWVIFIQNQPPGGFYPESLFGWNLREIYSGVQMKPKNQDKNGAGVGIAIGAGVGVALGAGIGAAIGNIAVGVGVGVAIGAALGVVFAQKDEKDQTDNE